MQIRNMFKKHAHQSTYPAATNLELGAGAGLLDLDGLGILSVASENQKVGRIKIERMMGTMRADV